ncbi:MAG: hypothetical protein JXA21_08185 [Anaerolineae bacterium]|nr:hypothetical protein [Anaerolineae bacterium]
MIAKLKARRDLLADLAVFGVVVLALVLGLLLRNSTLYSTEKFAFDNLGITGRVPAGWLKEFGSDPLLRVRNPMAGEFSPMLELRTRPLAAEADVALVLDALALDRAASVDAYKALGVTQVLVKEDTATQRRFAYVEVNHNPYIDRLPVVVEGVDLALRHEGRVVVVTFVAEKDSFDLYYRYFRTFVEGLEFEVVK